MKSPKKLKLTNFCLKWQSLFFPFSVSPFPCFWLMALLPTLNSWLVSVFMWPFTLIHTVDRESSVWFSCAHSHENLYFLWINISLSWTTAGSEERTGHLEKSRDEGKQTGHLPVDGRDKAQLHHLTSSNNRYLREAAFLPFFFFNIRRLAYLTLCHSTFRFDAFLQKMLSLNQQGWGRCRSDWRNPMTCVAEKPG